MTGVKKYRIFLAAAVLLVLACGSCTNDGRADESGMPDLDNRAIKVAAQAAAAIETRTDGTLDDDGGNGEGTEGGGRYVESGQIFHGLFSLGYNHKGVSPTFRVADVDFDNGQLAGLGVGIISTDEGFKELEWSHINGTGNAPFYMDNVLNDYTSTSKHAQEAVFDNKNGNNPFVAGLFDDVNGTNDLLWGTKSVARSSNLIVMDLHHMMSIVRVEVRVDQSANNELRELDLSSAKVSISQLVHKPYSFNRLDGTISLDEQAPDYQPITLVDPENDEDLCWKSTEITTLQSGDSEKEYMVYKSKDFVLPPQGVSEDAQRPRLNIKFYDKAAGKERSFTGILPFAMWENPGSDDAPNGIPRPLAFLPEHKLTIRTVISGDPPELEFMPVLVIEWVDKGTFTVDGHHAGIYSKDEFLQMIEAYNNRNDAKLGNYGYLAGADFIQWHFNVFAAFTLKYEDIHGKMIPDGSRKLPYTLFTNRYIINVVKEADANGEGWTAVVDGDQLLEILSSGKEWTPPLPEPEEPDTTGPSDGN